MGDAGGCTLTMGNTPPLVLIVGTSAPARKIKGDFMVTIQAFSLLLLLLLLSVVALTTAALAVVVLSSIVYYSLLLTVWYYTLLDFDTLTTSTCTYHNSTVLTSIIPEQKTRSCSQSVWILVCVHSITT